jgi:DNA polymerase-4
VRCSAIFATISPDVEPLSLDEAFIDVTASLGLLGPPLAIGRLLRERMRAATGLAVSVGIAAGKMVAKIASDVAKPDGLLEVPPDAVRAFLDPLPVGRLWGVGPVTQAALAAGGPPHRRRRQARDAGGARRGRRPRGPSTSRASRAARMRDSSSRTATRAATARRAPSTPTHATTAAFAAPSSRTPRPSPVASATTRSVARTVVLKMKLAARTAPGKFRLLTRRATLAEATDDGHALAAVALRLWEEHRPSIALRLIGVAAAGLEGGAGQVALFPDAVRARARR